MYEIAPKVSYISYFSQNSSKMLVIAPKTQKFLLFQKPRLASLKELGSTHFEARVERQVEVLAAIFFLQRPEVELR